MREIDEQHLTGKNDRFIDYPDTGKGLHQEVVKPFDELRSAASEQGFELAIASGYRSFDRQLSIWNAKIRGERQVLDDNGQPVNLAELTPWEQVQAILRWSALPGASRHHWGTDIDIYDKAAVSKNYRPALTLDEVAKTGPFAPMHAWLDQRIVNSLSWGFFRPYRNSCTGVAPERWHLSYAPLSAKFQSELTVEYLVAAIADEPLMLKEVVLDHIDEIYWRFVNIPQTLYPEKYQYYLSGNCDTI